VRIRCGILTASLAVLCLASCTKVVTKETVRVEYRDVFIAVPCRAKKPEKRPIEDNPMLNHVNALEYCEELEIVADGCIEWAGE